jgi:hypothetical protein
MDRLAPDDTFPTITVTPVDAEPFDLPAAVDGHSPSSSSTVVPGVHTATRSCRPSSARRTNWRRSESRSSLCGSITSRRPGS